jgi:hypothetical protein
MAIYQNRLMISQIKKTNDEGSVKDLLGTKENDLLKKDQNQSSSIEESILKKIN